MTYGMITGQGLANNHKLSDYFHGGCTDYVKARRMVNATDKAAAIAKIADGFEQISLDAKAETANYYQVHNL